jgi:ParB family chromosome partitioning protein
MDVPVDTIVPDPGNPHVAQDENFAALVDSIRVLGILQPLHVRRAGQEVQLIDGERRWRAAQMVGLPDRSL